MLRNKHVYDEDKPHWLWNLVGVMLGMIGLSLVFAWMIERIA
jgi:hypothetical protein